MSETLKRDPLLTSARWLVNLILVLLVVMWTGVLGAAIAAPFFQSQILEKIAAHARGAAHGAPPAGSEVIVAIVVLLALLAAIVMLAFFWLRELRRIIDSVGQGDPFAHENAGRLARMGWLTVAIEGISIPGGAVAGYLSHVIRRVEIDVGLSLGGVLMALVLFILARVFREGARMRDDLEGTV